MSSKPPNIEDLVNKPTSTSSKISSSPLLRHQDLAPLKLSNLSSSVPLSSASSVSSPNPTFQSPTSSARASNMSYFAKPGASSNQQSRYSSGLEKQRHSESSPDQAPLASSPVTPGGIFSTAVPNREALSTSSSGSQASSSASQTSSSPLPHLNSFPSSSSLNIRKRSSNSNSFGYLDSFAMTPVSNNTTPYLQQQQKSSTNNSSMASSSVAPVSLNLTNSFINTSLSSISTSSSSFCSNVYSFTTDYFSAVSVIPGYTNIEPIYPFYQTSVSMYRAKHIESGENVFLKVSCRGNLEDLVRIRHEWSVTSASGDTDTDGSDFPKSENTPLDASNTIPIPKDLQIASSNTHSTRSSVDSIRSNSHRLGGFNTDARVTGPTYSLSDIYEILRSERCVSSKSDPRTVILTYKDEGLVTLYEKYISGSHCASRTVNSDSQNPDFSSTDDSFRAKFPANAGPNLSNTTKKKIPINRSRESLIEIIHIVSRIVEIMNQVHERNITHNGLTTSSIFINNKKELFISGWDFSFPLKVEDVSRGYLKTFLNRIKEYLGYVSPESTGLTRRLVDYRSDYYSIGCILYELLVGFLPFSSDDPFDLTKMHVLRAPTSPHAINSDIPEALSSIVLNLLEKNADERYQTSKLILSDLEHVLRILDGTEQEDLDFEPNASQKVSPVFLLPQILYGREEELSILKSCYKREEERDFQFIFVTGEPGSGKTRLVNELERLSLSRNAFFCSSKFDPYQRGPPFYSIVTVLKDVVHQILCESVQSITRWRDNIISRLRVELAVLFETIPELRDLLGQEYSKLLPKPRHLGPVPRELRFKYVVKSLFCLFGSQGLTIFLDDVQWCPQTELDFFRELATFATENVQDGIHITFVCASTLESQRYQELVELCKDLTLKHEVVNLNPLSYEATEELINDTMTTCSARRTQSTFSSVMGPPSVIQNENQKNKKYAMSMPPSGNPGEMGLKQGSPKNDTIHSSVDPQVSSLAQIVHKVTNGNPLFISLLMEDMHRNGLIYYDESNRLVGGRWKVDFEHMIPTEIPLSITDTVIRSVNTLPPQTIRILKYAACICSNSFTLQDLAISANVSYSEAASALHYAFGAQLLLPTTVHYKFPFPDPVGTTNIEIYDDEVRKVAAAATYRFYHDLIQQAVYSLLSLDEATETHRLIALRLLGDSGYVDSDSLESSQNDSDAKESVLRNNPIKFNKCGINNVMHREPREVHKIVEIANQLKNSTPIVKDSERLLYIDLAVQAGDSVYGMSDFDMAYFYFDSARQLLPTDSTAALQQFPEYFLHIYLNLVELQYNRKNFKDCLELIDQVFPLFEKSIDKAALLKTQTKVQYALSLPNEAITTGIKALNYLGLDFKEDEKWNEMNHHKLRHRIPLSFIEIRQLALDMKPASDPFIILAQEIISIITIPILLSHRPNLFRSLIYTSVVKFVDYGATASCSFSFLSLASLFQRAGENTNLSRAYEYSNLAIVTLEYDNALGLDFGINIYEYYALTLAIYFEPLCEVIRYYDVVLSLGQTFDNHCGMLSLSYDLRPLCKFLAAEPLPNILSNFTQIKPVTIQGNDAAGKLWIQLHSQAVANLMGIGNSDPCVLSGKYIGDANKIASILSTNNELQYIYYVVKLILAVVHRSKYLAADIICNRLPKAMAEFPVTLYHVMVTFLGALAIVDKEEKTKKEMELLDGFSRDLKYWSKSNPSMFMHKSLLVQAEIFRLNLKSDDQPAGANEFDFADNETTTDVTQDEGGEIDSNFDANANSGYTSIMILDLYEDAITSAINEGFIQDAAMINERCGDFLLQHSKKRSLTYFKEAVRLYTIWGAKRRAQQILAKTPELEYPSYGISNMANVNLSIVDLSDNSKGNNTIGGTVSTGNTSLESFGTNSTTNTVHSMNIDTGSTSTVTTDSLHANGIGNSNNSNSVAGMKDKAESQLLKNLALHQQQLSNTQSSSPLRWILSNLFREGRAEGNTGSNSEKEKKQSVSLPSDFEVASPVVPAPQQNSPESSSPTSYEATTGDLELKTALQYCLDISEAIEVDSVLVKFVNSVMKSSGADYCVFVSLDNDEPYIDAIGILNGVRLCNHEPMSSRADVPLSVVYQVVSSGQLLSKDDDPSQFELVYGRDSYFQTRHSQSVLCMPIQNQLKTVGAVYIEHQSLANIFTQPRIELLGLLCTQVVMSLEKAKLYHQMEVAKRAAEEATEEKASFLANMSHEIRTPFNALLSCSIFLLDTKLSDIQREYVEIIRSSAMLTLNIIDAILAFSKIEHGSITLENSPFSLRECIESAIQLVAEPAAKKDLELVHLNRCGEIDIIYGDVTRVRQIIINLVGNAVKFTSKGHILVETHAEKVSSDNRYEFVITVKDTGIGIPKSARNKVFRAFSQVDGSSRRVYGGSGLGLAISKKLAELMGGNLSFESNGEDKEGTTFWFDLVAFAKKQEDEYTEELRRKYQGKKVLVVDHLDKTMESLVVELERLGFVVDTCGNVEEAIDMTKRSCEELNEGSGSIKQIENGTDGVNSINSSNTSLEKTGDEKAVSISKRDFSPNLSTSSPASSLSLNSNSFTIPTDHRYALVFIDGKLLSPECSELTLLKSFSGTTQVIFMTTFGAPIPEDAQEKGISAILMRPVQRSKLFKVINAVLNPQEKIAEYDQMGNLYYTSASMFSGLDSFDDEGDETESVKKGTRRIAGMEGVEGVEESCMDMETSFQIGSMNDNSDSCDNGQLYEMCCKHDCTNSGRQNQLAQRPKQHSQCGGEGSRGLNGDSKRLQSGKNGGTGVHNDRKVALFATPSNGNGRPMLASKHPLKILLAEDNPINTRVALQHLRRMGYEADHAKDGVEVLSMCERQKDLQKPMYDCILMDIQMPNKDGIAAAQELMELYNDKERPQVIALTANAAGEDRQRCLSVGMSNYLAKPILPDDLADVLKAVEPLKKRNGEI